MEVHESARKHGVEDRDIQHAIDHALVIVSDERIHGHTRSGEPIGDAEVRALAAEAEAGFDVETLIGRRGKRGRPTLGSAPATVESVRLDPELRADLLERARSEGTTTSDIIREALRRFLHAA